MKIPDENIICIMPTIHRIARTFHYLSKTSRYLFSDSRQRICAYFLIFLCFLTPSSTSFVLYQGTTQKLEYQDISMLRALKIEERRTIYQFCDMVINLPVVLTTKMTPDQMEKATPICKQLLIGFKKVRELEKASRNIG